ncbi:hypothetical protein HANVADRAFT_47060 [Hanseniaspora valbyensis NRRL Y-1626]|uniref:Uncharacterized protein n=1 Tax=Hanseniaspora valbyensis NRRL Y-1626 TaxID=766949 RepID=A0A1B7TJG4_9ASCO|nr:hypothetical protein HANVADRAFT_47060 [Hanseniaspora valbyensis NRRL Y-1626]
MLEKVDHCNQELEKLKIVIADTENKQIKSSFSILYEKIKEINKSFNLLKNEQLKEEDIESISQRVVESAINEQKKDLEDTVHDLQKIPDMIKKLEKDFKDSSGENETRMDTKLKTLKEVLTTKQNTDLKKLKEKVENFLNGKLNSITESIENLQLKFDQETKNNNSKIEELNLLNEQLETDLKLEKEWNGQIEDTMKKLFSEFKKLQRVVEENTNEIKNIAIKEEEHSVAIEAIEISNINNNNKTEAVKEEEKEEEEKEEEEKEEEVNIQNDLSVINKDETIRKEVEVNCDSAEVDKKEDLYLKINVEPSEAICSGKTLIEEEEEVKEEKSLLVETKLITITDIEMTNRNMKEQEINNLVIECAKKIENNIKDTHESENKEMISEKKIPRDEITLLNVQVSDPSNNMSDSVFCKEKEKMMQKIVDNIEVVELEDYQGETAVPSECDDIISNTKNIDDDVVVVDEELGDKEIRGMKSIEIENGKKGEKKSIILRKTKTITILLCLSVIGHQIYTTTKRNQ